MIYLTQFCWSILALVLGACVGSFVNVVIYRWSRDLSIRRPARSFCPACEKTIAWYDNIPVLSFLLLGGRCRHCRAVISWQYPLVELATAFVFLLTYDGFFVTRQRLGIGADLSIDWPMLLAHWALWAGLVAVVVMDLEAYLVDVRVTWLIVAAGMLGHALWTPSSSRAWVRPDGLQAAWAAAVAVGLLIGGLLMLRYRSGPEAQVGSQQPLEEPPSDELPTPPVSSSWVWPLVLLPVGLVLTYLIAMNVNVTPPFWAGNSGMVRLVIGLAALFAWMTLAASNPQPEADAQIVEAIRDEAPVARHNVLWELKLLVPAIALSSAILVLFGPWGSPASREAVEGLLHWRAVGDWQPLWGLATALTGWVISGALGWLMRIWFTLALGKEALGMGDVHILAAAGAVAGWPVVLIGFFLAAFLALLGIVVIHLRRQSRALPYGPWLALAFLIASMFQDHLLVYVGLR